MNNYHYIAISKALSWYGKDDSMVKLCVNEFLNMKIPEEFVMDTKERAIDAAKGNNFPKDLISLFEV